jgi:hypothetical protein
MLPEGDLRKFSEGRCMNSIEKLDNVIWYGHCVIHLLAAINDLPDEAKLVFCRDLEKFIKRQERLLPKA